MVISGWIHEYVYTYIGKGGGGGSRRKNMKVAIAIAIVWGKNYLASVAIYIARPASILLVLAEREERVKN